MTCLLSYLILGDTKIRKMDFVGLALNISGKALGGHVGPYSTMHAWQNVGVSHGLIPMDVCCMCMFSPLSDHLTIRFIICGVWEE